MPLIVLLNVRHVIVMEAYAGMHAVKQCVKLDAMKLTVIVVVTVIGPRKQPVETVMELYVGIIVAEINVLLEVVQVENNKQEKIFDLIYIF